jgi:hypothetical protein
MRRRSRSIGIVLGNALLMAALLSSTVGSETASAASPCHPVEVEATKIRVAVTAASCEIGRQVAVGYVERALAEERPDGKTPDGSVYYEVDGFRCLTGLGGSQLFCHHGDESVFASSRPEDHPASFDEATSSGSSCPSVHTHLITGREVETSPGFGRSGASKVMRKYFRLVLATAQTEGGCAQKRYSSGCDVGDYRCRATYSTASRELHGVCRGPKCTVGFEEIDRAPGYGDVPATSPVRPQGGITSRPGVARTPRASRRVDHLPRMLYPTLSYDPGGTPDNWHRWLKPRSWTDEDDVVVRRAHWTSWNATSATARVRVAIAGMKGSGRVTLSSPGYCAAAHAYGFLHEHDYGGVWGKGGTIDLTQMCRG